MARRPDPFPPDGRLRARMALVIVLDALLTLVLVAAVVWLVSHVRDAWVVVLFLVTMSVGGASNANRKRDELFADIMPRAERERVEAAVQRLCVVADMRAPRMIVVLGEVPQCWTTAFPFRRPRIAVSEGLLELLDDRELEAVLAHELSHVAQGDAVVMTLAAAPGVWVMRSLRAIWEGVPGARPPLWIRVMMAFLVALGIFVVPWAIVGSILSRFRELTADEGAARLTGSPAAVAAALVALSDEVARPRATDLRTMYVPETLNIVPLRPAGGIGRLWATHPPLEARLAALERMEAWLQSPTARTSAR